MDKLQPPSDQIVVYVQYDPQTHTSTSCLTDKKILEAVIDFFVNRPTPFKMDLYLEQLLKDLSKTSEKIESKGLQFQKYILDQWNKVWVKSKL